MTGVFTPCIFVLNSTNMIEKKLVPLQGDEIGRLIANALEGGIVDRRPWYDPAERTPDQPVISVPLQTDYDSLVVDMPVAKNSGATPLKPDHKPPRSNDKRGS
jgi:hypothetical protein